VPHGDYFIEAQKDNPASVKITRRTRFSASPIEKVTSRWKARTISACAHGPPYSFNGGAEKTFPAAATGARRPGNRNHRVRRPEGANRRSVASTLRPGARPPPPVPHVLHPGRAFERNYRNRRTEEEEARRGAAISRTADNEISQRQKDHHRHWNQLKARAPQEDVSENAAFLAGINQAAGPGSRWPAAAGRQLSDAGDALRLSRTP